MESRSVRKYDSPSEDCPQGRFHQEIDSYLMSVSLLVRGDELMDTVTNHQEVIDRTYIGIFIGIFKDDIG